MVIEIPLLSSTPAGNNCPEHAGGTYICEQKSDTIVYIYWRDVVEGILELFTGHHLYGVSVSLGNASYNEEHVGAAHLRPPLALRKIGEPRC